LTLALKLKSSIKFSPTRQSAEVVIAIVSRRLTVRMKTIIMGQLLIQIKAEINQVATNKCDLINQIITLMLELAWT
jgi:hypothetical protein